MPEPMRLLKLLFICLVLPLFLPVDAPGQVIINEVCTYNGAVLEDEDGDEPDWIELYNSGSLPVNLYHFSLEKGFDGPWYFPQVVIQPGAFLVVFTSGKNRLSPFLHTDFKLSKEGALLRLFNAVGSIEDELVTPVLHMDHSFGKKPDGNGITGIFQVPTPGNSNQFSESFTGYTSDPEFSLEAGLYNGPRILEITASSNASIHYTLDGTVPEVTSQNYTGPIAISSTSVVRVRAFSNLSTVLPSRVVSRTYLLNYNTTLPVFSITTDPDNLWDWNTGILVTGPNASPNYPYYGANYWLDVEVPVHVEFFEEDGSLKISQDAGLSINGGTSNRTKPMKSLRLTTKSKYGDKGFDHRFFLDKPIDDFRILVLRNSSGDFNKTHFRDGSLHELMIGKVNIDLSAYRPAAVFLNGDYYGIQNIREKISKHYLGENYGIDISNVDLLEEDSTVIEGDFSIFNSHHAFITGNDMSVPANFIKAAQMFDLESLCDYYIAETYLSNIDWPYNNLKLWRVREPQAKWRYILIDLDIALGNNGWAPADFDILGRIMGTYGNNNRHVQIFKSVLNNTTFREYFINRYADLMNTLFTPDNMSAHILKVRERIAGEMPMHFNEWGNDMTGWDQEIFQVVMPHIYDRPAFAKEQVRNVFSLEGIVPVEIDVWPPGAGLVQINTITPGNLPWKGDYFNGNHVTITVKPNAGFHFVRWDSENIPLTFPENHSIRVNPETSNKFTAYFASANGMNEMMIYPNPSHGDVTLGYFSEKRGIASLEAISATGQRIALEENITLQQGINMLEIKAGSLTSGVYMLKLISETGSFSGRLIIL